MPTYGRFPRHANLEHLQKQAKDLLKAHKSGDLEACQQIKDFLPRLSTATLQDIQNTQISLQEMQHVIARACRFDNWAALKLFFDATDQRAKLRAAISNNDITAIQGIIGEEPELLHTFLQSRNWGPPLSHAATVGKLEAVKCLLDLGAQDTKYALERACLQGHLDIADHLLQVNPNIPIDDQTLGACETLNFEGLKFLLDHGADPNIRRNQAPLDMAIGTYDMRPSRQACINALIEAGAEHQDNAAFALLRGRIDLLKLQIQDDPDVVYQHFDIAEGRGRSFFGGTSSGAPLQDTTLLHICAQFNFVKETKLLIENGADVNARAKPDHSGCNHTPIYHAIISNLNFCFPMLQLLLNQGADTSLKSTLRLPRDGKLIENVTPLEYAFEFPQPPYNILDVNGKAQNEPHEAVVELFEKDDV